MWCHVAAAQACDFFTILKHSNIEERERERHAFIEFQNVVVFGQTLNLKFHLESWLPTAPTFHAISCYLFTFSFASRRAKWNSFSKWRRRRREKPSEGLKKTFFLSNVLRKYLQDTLQSSFIYLRAKRRVFGRSGCEPAVRDAQLKIL